MDLDEPIYLNLFTVSIQASDLPAGLGATQDDVNIILEGVRQVSGLDTQPGLGGAAVQKYKWAERGFTGGAPAKTHLELQLTSDTDDNYTYKFLRRWADLCYDPLTGRMSIKKNYAAKRAVITMQDKEGVPVHQWTVYNIFPTSAVPAPPLSYDSGAIWSGFNMTFWVDYFDESIL